MEVRLIPLDRVVEDPGQPRSRVDDEALSELADSIKRHGILNPITVVPMHNVGMFRIVTGERRWRAASLAGLSEMPCIVRELEPEEIRTQQLIENIQREDLSPLDRARGVAALQDSTGATTRDVAAMLGVSERTVNNLVALLELPRDIGERIVSSPNRPADGQLTEKHARYIKQLAEDPDRQRRVADRVRDERLSSADTASLVRALRDSPELSDEILTAPAEALTGYLKGKDRAAEARIQASAASHTADVVRACTAALNEVRPVGLPADALQSLQSALAEMRALIESL
jgi:ParB family chromosome partitioning protein